MFKTRQLPLVLITFFAWFSATPLLKAAAFDLSADFPTNSNPGGAWTFGWKTNVTGALVPFTIVQPNQSPYFSWARFADDASVVQKNVSGQPVSIEFGQGVALPGEVMFSAGYDLREDNFGAIRFTAPSNGVYSVSSAVRSYVNGPASGDSDFHVVKNGVELFGAELVASSSTVTNWSGYTNSLALNTGDTLDFLAGRGLDGSYHGALLKIQLSIASAPPVITTNLLVLPNSLRTNDYAFGAGTLTVALRSQQIYGSSQFPGGPIQIQQIRFRPDRQYGNAFTTTVSNLQVSLSTTARQPQALSSTFADNVGGDNTVVFNGSVSLSSTFSGPAEGPKDFDIIINLQTPFTYDPANGNLLLDTRNASATGVSVLSGHSSDPAVARVYSTDLNGASGLVNVSSADALELVYVPVAGTSPVITTQPVNQVIRWGSNATFTVAATGTAALYYQWLFNSAPITGATNPVIAFAATNLNQSGSYQVIVTNSFGSVTSSVAELQVVAEVVRPTITVTAPVGGTRLTNATVLAKGKAGDNSKTIKKVLYQLNGGSWLTVTGTTNWSVLLNLVPGTNTFSACSVDSSGNTSLTNTRRVFRVVKSVLTIAATGTGSGQVVSNLNGKLLEIGRGYSVTATPASNSVFGGWTTNNASQLFLAQKLTFLMSSNLVLHPIFSAENPFAAGKGLYQGLFSESSNIRQGSSGFLSLQLTDKGAISGRVMVDGGVHQFQGRMSLEGETVFEISRSGKTALIIALTANLDGSSDGALEGTVTDGSWTAVLEGGRAAQQAGQFDAALVGRYTAAFQDSVLSDNGLVFPAGSSHGTLTISAAGLIQFSGHLADGTPITQSASILKSGHWLLYIPVYEGKGSVYSRVTLNSAAGRSLTGEINWIKPVNPAARYYPQGFNVGFVLQGSGYARPAVGQRVIDGIIATFTLFAGNVTNTIVEGAVLSSDNKIVINGVSKPTMVVNLDNGTFTGSFIHPATRLTTPIRGVFLENDDIAVGYFLGINTGGSVRFVPLPPAP